MKWQSKGKSRRTHALIRSKAFLFDKVCLPLLMCCTDELKMRMKCFPSLVLKRTTLRLEFGASLPCASNCCGRHCARYRIRCTPNFRCSPRDAPNSGLDEQFHIALMQLPAQHTIVQAARDKNQRNVRRTDIVPLLLNSTSKHLHHLK